jgi:hypothetical protein
MNVQPRPTSMSTSSTGPNGPSAADLKANPPAGTGSNKTSLNLDFLRFAKRAPAATAPPVVQQYSPQTGVTKLPVNSSASKDTATSKAAMMKNDPDNWHPGDPLWDIGAGGSGTVDATGTPDPIDSKPVPDDFGKVYQHSNDQSWAPPAQDSRNQGAGGTTSGDTVGKAQQNIDRRSRRIDA